MPCDDDDDDDDAHSVFISRRVVVTASLLMCFQIFSPHKSTNKSMRIVRTK